MTGLCTDIVNLLCKMKKKRREKKKKKGFVSKLGVILINVPSTVEHTGNQIALHGPRLIILSVFCMFNSITVTCISYKHFKQNFYIILCIPCKISILLIACYSQRRTNYKICQM